MINQQINLYQDRFREKLLWLSAVQLAIIFTSVLVIGGIWSYFQITELEHARQASREIKHNQEQLANELNAANAELASLLEDKSLDHKINYLTGEISARKRVLIFVDSNQLGSGEGFSSYLTALSNLHMENVWLEEVSLAQNFIRIKGSALQADLVPAYFNRFTEQAIFQGSRFDIFELNRPGSSDWKVDFKIATSLFSNE